MKKIIILQAIITLTVSFTIHAMERSWKQEIESVTKEILACYTAIPIDVALWLRKIVHRPIMAQNPDKFIQINQSKLKKIERDIRKKQELQINAIFKENGLNEKQIEESKDRLKDVHEIYKQLLCESNQNITHDPQLKDSIDIIHKQFTEKKMNINSINIIQSDIHADFGGSNTALAAAHSPHFEVKTSNEKTFLETTKPAQIVFRPSTLNSPHINAYTLHEAEHIIEGHGIITGTTNFLVEHFTNNTIKQTNILHKLYQIQEQQAEILPSLRNKQSASLMRNQRFLSPYPHMLYSEHYLQLSDIDETHKMIDYLEHIKKHPRKPMPQVKRSKFF